MANEIYAGNPFQINVVASDPELRPSPAQGPYFVLWAGPCRYPGGTWFNWDRGRVLTKGADRAIAAKMLELARWLEARVQGNHGEFYQHPEDMPVEEDLAASLQRRPWWRFW